MKPENVLLRDGVVQLCDFGSSFRRTVDAVTSMSPFYSAPEVFSCAQRQCTYPAVKPAPRIRVYVEYVSDLRSGSGADGTRWERRHNRAG